MAGSLGRHVEHDRRSWDFPALVAPGIPSQSVHWQRRSPVLDQGDLGSCTGNAAAGWLATDNALRQGAADVSEAMAVELYSKATHLDRVRGFYPPEDTGSSGLAVAKAMVRLGMTTGPYRHAFGLEHTLQAMQHGPVLVGLHWLTGCDHPDHTGQVSYTGSIRGGHEILADQLDVAYERIWFTNSWGTGWGAHGRFWMTFADFARALADRGDVTVPS